MPTREREILRVTLLVVLTFVTGLMDAVGYLALDKVFTGNMTGNIVILGMALAGAPGLPVLGPLLAFVGFALGAWLAGLVLRRTGGEWTTRHTVLLACGAAIATVIGVALLFLPSPPPHEVAIVAAPLIAVQMGCQGMVARHLAVRDLTTVVVTSTLVSLAGESLVQGGWGSVWNRRAIAIVSILAGAAAGALMLRLGAGWPVLAAAALTVAVAVVGHLRWPDRAGVDAARGARGGAARGQRSSGSTSP